MFFYDRPKGRFFSKQKPSNGKLLGFLFSIFDIEQDLLYMFNNHKSNSQSQIGGKMTSKGADKVGLIQAVALCGFALASIILAVSALILALK